MFDYYGGYIPISQIDQYGRRFDAVWGSVEPVPWTAVHPGMFASQYFIMGLDQYSVTHHTLTWWQQNHPDWIFYACTASGSPTRDIAVMGGIDVPDMPLDIHNSSAVAYQISTMARAAKSAGYTALAIDQVVFWNIYKGGNPNFGQTKNSTEYGCGSWHGSTFQRHYASPTDPAYITDVLNFVAQARSIAHSYGLTLIVNHPAGSIGNSAERQLLANTDIVQDETGFSDYGRYRTGNGSTFHAELPYVRYAQEHGTGVLVIDKFINETTVDTLGFEYSLATYLLGNEGGLLLYVGTHYGTLQYHPEYNAAIGRACSAVSGGPSVYSRRFSGGLSVVNASAYSASFKLPAGTYHDIEGRTIHSTLSLTANDAYVLLGGSGC